MVGREGKKEFRDRYEMKLMGKAGWRVMLLLCYRYQATVLLLCCERKEECMCEKDQVRVRG